MKSIRFGRTNVQVPTLGLGTWAHGGPKLVDGRPVGWYGTDPDAARDTLLEAWTQGVTHWDTADVYGDGRAEELIGSVWDAVPRERIFLATKVGWDPGPFDHYYHPEQIRRQLDASLRHLKTDHVDLYYLHHCDFGANDEYLDDAVDAIARLREEGKLRFVGLSDWKNDVLRRYAERIRPEVVQCYRNVVDDSYEESGLRGWVESADAGVAFFSPLKHALLLGRFEGPVTFGRGDHRSNIKDFRDFNLLSRLRACRRELERRFDGHPSPLLHGLLGSLLADAPTGVVLVGIRRPLQLREAIPAAEPLAPEAARWVRQLYQENGRATRAAWRTYQPR
jgi:aryl-alcohol dehydrogenase-like predicted oxidoreductase